MSSEGSSKPSTKLSTTTAVMKSTSPVNKVKVGEDDKRSKETSTRPSTVSTTMKSTGMSIVCQALCKQGLKCTT